MEFLAWVRAEAGRRPIHLCFAMVAVNHDLLREWGEIPPGVRILHTNVAHPEIVGLPDYDVQQRRWGLYDPADRWLDRRGHPVFAIRREGGDLLRALRFEEFVEAFRLTKDVPIPRYLHR
ncbi:MAG: hypothetical protein ACLQGP_17775 [Isosphaeraceae bacterium]